MQKRKLTGFNLSGLHQNVKYQKGELSKPHPLVKSFYSRDGWPFINWRFRIVQSLRDYLGHYPDILYQRGKLKIWGTLTRTLCNNSLTPSSKPSSPSSRGVRQKLPNVQARIEAAMKRLEYASSCGSKGSVYVVVRLDMGKEERTTHFHPIRCHSVFCPTCAKEWGSKVGNRIRDIFNRVSEAHFVTLTVKNTVCKSPEEVNQSIETFLSYLSKLYSIQITNQSISRIEDAFRKECRSYYRVASRKHGRNKARAKVRNQVRYAKLFLKHLRSFAGKHLKLGQVIGGVWRLEVKSKITAEGLELHPHFHGLLAVSIPKLMWNALWGMVVKSQVITDARLVKGSNAVSAYVSKYESKPETLPTGTGAISPEDARLWLEAALFNRQRVRIWGVCLLPKPQERKNLVLYAHWLRVYFETPPVDTFRAYLSLPEGQDRVFLTRGVVRDFRFSSEVTYDVQLYYVRYRGYVLEGIPEHALPSGPPLRSLPAYDEP